MVAKGSLKLIANYSSQGYPDADYALYDLTTDPWEMNDLSENLEYRPVFAELKQALEDHCQRYRQRLPEKMPPVVPRQRWNIDLPYDPWSPVEAFGRDPE